ncbi:MAG: hypothetical protein ACRDPF_10560, partial [Streptosporangiaceae bacterium]
PLKPSSTNASRVSAAGNPSRPAGIDPNPKMITRQFLPDLRSSRYAECPGIGLTGHTGSVTLFLHGGSR